MKYRENCEIVEKKIFSHYLYLKLRTVKIAAEAKPGQFINVRAYEDSFDPLLRRPMSICDSDGECISILVLVKGRSTKLLSEKCAGDYLNILGPLGNSFPETGKKAVFAAGGVGIAPFLFFSRILKPEVLLFGVRSKEFLPDMAPFMETMNIRIATEDGSSGTKGTVLDLLKEIDLGDKSLYACGPNPMLGAINGELKKYGSLDAWYSIETMMGCGFGACKGCAVETPGGDYKLACVDGPVFRWDGVKL